MCSPISQSAVGHDVLIGADTARHSITHADGVARRAGVWITETDHLVGWHGASFADSRFGVVQRSDAKCRRSCGRSISDFDGYYDAAKNGCGGAATFEEKASAELFVFAGVHCVSWVEIARCDVQAACLIKKPMKTMTSKQWKTRSEERRVGKEC